MFCKHEWEVISEKILPSAFEQVEPNLKSIENAPVSFYTKKIIIIIKCKKCGKLNKTVESNP